MSRWFSGCIEPQEIRGSAARATFDLDVYPRGLLGENALIVQFFCSHFEHPSRFATCSSKASQPQSRANVRGSAVLSCPHAEHFSMLRALQLSGRSSSRRSSRRTKEPPMSRNTLNNRRRDKLSADRAQRISSTRNIRSSRYHI